MLKFWNRESEHVVRQRRLFEYLGVMYNLVVKYPPDQQLPFGGFREEDPFNHMMVWCWGEIEMCLIASTGLFVERRPKGGGVELLAHFDYYPPMLPVQLEKQLTEIVQLERKEVSNYGG